MASSIPGAVQALITMMDPLQGGVLPAGTQVWFGLPLSRYIAPVTLQITSVRIEQDDIVVLGPSYRHEEVYSIECILTECFGDGNHLQRFLDVFTTYNTIETTIANNPTLNQNVRVAIPEKTGYSPTADQKGLPVGTLTFEIRCEQRVNSLS